MKRVSEKNSNFAATNIIKQIYGRENHKRK